MYAELVARPPGRVGAGAGAGAGAMIEGSGVLAVESGRQQQDDDGDGGDENGDGGDGNPGSTALKGSDGGYDGGKSHAAAVFMSNRGGGIPHATDTAAAQAENHGVPTPLLIRSTSPQKEGQRKKKRGSRNFADRSDKIYGDDDHQEDDDDDDIMGSVTPLLSPQVYCVRERE